MIDVVAIDDDECHCHPHFPGYTRILTTATRTAGRRRRRRRRRRSWIHWRRDVDSMREEETGDNDE